MSVNRETAAVVIASHHRLGIKLPPSLHYFHHFNPIRSILTKNNLYRSSRMVLWATVRSLKLSMKSLAGRRKGSRALPGACENLWGVNMGDVHMASKRRVFAVFTAFLIVFALTSSRSEAAQVQLAWNAPTTYADGTPLMDLAGHGVSYGQTSRNYH